MIWDTANGQLDGIYSHTDQPFMCPRDGKRTLTSDMYDNIEQCPECGRSYVLEGDMW